MIKMAQVESGGVGRRTFSGQQNKIAKLNIHTRLLSAKLSSIKIGKLLESKKKQ